MMGNVYIGAQDKYLGLLAFFNRSKKQTFKDLKNENSITIRLEGKTTLTS